MSTALATLAGKLAERVGMDSVDPQELITTLRQTAFKGDASDAQFIALLIVANQYGLNPWTKEIYAFPDKQNGIVPVVGVDGWSRRRDHFRLLHYKARLGISRPFCYQKSPESTAAG